MQDRKLEARHLAAMRSGWSMAGVRQSGRHAAELPLALAAIRLWADLADDLGADLAEIAAMLVALPNNAAIAELLVNMRLEEML